MNKSPKTPDNTAERTQMAAEECRAAARLAHERIQDLKALGRELEARAAELLAELAAAKAAAETYTVTYFAEHVPSVIRARLAEVLPLLVSELRNDYRAVIAEIREELARRGANSPRAVVDGLSAAYFLAGPSLSLACPFCAARNSLHASSESDGEPPAPGDASLCWTCGDLAVLDTEPDGALRLRRPNLTESLGFQQSPMIQGMLADYRALMKKSRNERP